jgi:hypothetical protein
VTKNEYTKKEVHEDMDEEQDKHPDDDKLAKALLQADAAGMVRQIGKKLVDLKDLITKLDAKVK